MSTTAAAAARPGVLARLGRALEPAFPYMFVGYTALTVAVLALALLPTLLGVPASGPDDPLPTDAGGHIAALLGRTVVNAEQPFVLAVDYGLSLLSLGTALLLFIRRPRDPVARLLAVAMVSTSLAFNYQAHALFVGEAELLVRADVTGAHLPIPPFLNIIHLLYHGLSGAAYAHAFLLFPNGVLAAGWLRWPILGLYLMLIEEVVLGTGSFILGLPVFPILIVLLTVVFGTVVNEQGLPCTPETCAEGTLVRFDFPAIVASDVAFFILLFGFLIPAAGIYSIRARGSRLTPIERAQSRLVVATLVFAFAVGIAAVVAALVLRVAPTGGLSAAAGRDVVRTAQQVFPSLYAVIPVAVVVAILRYRLFDLDRLVNRALVYGSLSVALIAIYLVSVLVLQGFLRPLFAGGSDLAVAGATLVIVALFQPLRRRLQDLIDRRFDRARYDAARTIDAFSVRLRNEVELDAVRADLLDAVQETMRPDHASLWLRVR